MYPCICAVFILLMGQYATPSKAEMIFKELEALKPSQRATLEKFRASVEDMLPHDYMKEDLYLVRFLKSKDFRLRDSIKAIKETLEWRKANNMDDIDFEDFSDIQKDYPLYLDGVDKEGRVILEINFGAWPIRKAMVSGRAPKLTRYGVRAIELANRKVRAIREETGKNVTEWVMLANMDGFSVKESACPQCLPYYLIFVSSYEKNYPFSNGNTVLVNTPESFEIIMNLIRPVLNAQTRKVIKIFGFDRTKWEPYVQEHFPLEEIADWFGGYKMRGEEVQHNFK